MDFHATPCSGALFWRYFTYILRAVMKKIWTGDGILDPGGLQAHIAGQQRCC